MSDDRRDRPERLLEKARAGDEGAFGSLIRSFDPGFRRLAYRLLGDRDEMDDALQDAYVKAFVALPRFRGESSLGTWLYRVVYNTCLDRLRRARPVEFVGEPGLDEQDPADLVTSRTALAEALAELSTAERAVVLLVDAEGLSYEEAALVVGVPVGTIASRLSRARSALRRSLRSLEEGVCP